LPPKGNWIPDSKWLVLGNGGKAVPMTSYLKSNQNSKRDRFLNSAIQTCIKILILGSNYQFLLQQLQIVTKLKLVHHCKPSDIA
jgi:hypothetical protein